MAQSPQLQFYLARAAQANADAEAATLDNVRDRCRRSEEAWTVLAERAARAERLRTTSTSPSGNSALVDGADDELQSEDQPET